MLHNSCEFVKKFSLTKIQDKSPVSILAKYSIPSFSNIKCLLLKISFGKKLNFFSPYYELIYKNKHKVNMSLQM